MLCDYLGQYNDYTKFFCARSAGREPPTPHRIPKCKRGRECSGQLDRPPAEVRGTLSENPISGAAPASRKTNNRRAGTSPDRV